MLGGSLRGRLLGSVRQLSSGGSLGSVTWKPASHKGVAVRVNGDQVDAEAFAADLARGVDIWREEGRKAVWLKLDVDDMRLAPVAFKEGFEFHSAKGQKADMVKWLPSDIPNKVPPFGFHQVGVGALTINSKNEILLVKEKLRKIDRWKMPGGLVDPGESLAEAVTREVREETGVISTFHSVLGFWQRTLSPDQSDMYFVCRLSTANDEDSRITACPHEISEGIWMPLEEYLRDHSHPMLVTILDKNFGLKSGDDAKQASTPLLPNFEMGLTELQVSPKIEPFESYFASQPKREFEA